MDEMEIEVKEIIKKKMTRSTWVGRVERIGDEKWQRQQMGAQTVERKWRRGRPKLRCVLVLIIT